METARREYLKLNFAKRFFIFYSAEFFYGARWQVMCFEFVYYVYADINSPKNWQIKDRFI